MTSLQPSLAQLDYVGIINDAFLVDAVLNITTAIRYTSLALSTESALKISLILLVLIFITG